MFVLNIGPLAAVFSSARVLMSASSTVPTVPRTTAALG